MAESDIIPPKTKRLKSDPEDTLTYSSSDGSPTGTESFSDNIQSTYSSEFQAGITKFTHSESDEIPNQLSLWKRKHLELMNFEIVYKPEMSPLELIDREWKLTSEKENEKSTRIKKLVQNSYFTHLMDGIKFKNVDELKIDSPMWPLILNEQFSFKPEGVPEDLLLWFYSFHTYGKLFSTRLFKILKERDRGETLSEDHFRVLFDSFVSMFGMSSETSFVPCLKNQSVKIGDTLVCGAPDIVYNARESHQIAQKDEPLVVAVCEVTFTALDMTKEQYDEILRGKLKHRKHDRPKLTLTRPYDILKKEDRLELIKPFIKLGNLQKLQRR